MKIKSEPHPLWEGGCVYIYTHLQREEYIYIHILPLKESAMNLGLKLVSNNCGGFVVFFACLGFEVFVCF